MAVVGPLAMGGAFRTWRSTENIRRVRELSSSNGTPRAANFEFSYTTCRNISGPEDEAAGRKVYAGPRADVVSLAA